jgi:hypothetical protein
LTAGNPIHAVRKLTTNGPTKLKKGRVENGRTNGSVRTSEIHFHVHWLRA